MVEFRESGCKIGSLTSMSPLVRLFEVDVDKVVVAVRDRHIHREVSEPAAVQGPVGYV